MATNKLITDPPALTHDWTSNGWVALEEQRRRAQELERRVQELAAMPGPGVFTRMPSETDAQLRRRMAMALSEVSRAATTDNLTRAIYDAVPNVHWVDITEIGVSGSGNVLVQVSIVGGPEDVDVARQVVDDVILHWVPIGVKVTLQVTQHLELEPVPVDRSFEERLQAKVKEVYGGDAS